MVGGPPLAKGPPPTSHGPPPLTHGPPPAKGPPPTSHGPPPLTHGPPTCTPPMIWRSPSPVDLCGERAGFPLFCGCMWDSPVAPHPRMRPTVGVDAPSLLETP